MFTKSKGSNVPKMRHGRRFGAVALIGILFVLLAGESGAAGAGTKIDEPEPGHSGGAASTSTPPPNNQPPSNTGSDYSTVHQNRVSAVKTVAEKLDVFCLSKMPSPARCGGKDKKKCDDILTSVCTNREYSGNHIDFAKLKDPVLANAAVAADLATVTQLLQAISTAMGLSTAPQASPPADKKGGEKKDPGAAQVSEADQLRTALNNSVGKFDSGAGGVFTGITTEFAATAIQGLAKLLQDRAKWEAASWFLDRMGQDICGENKPEQKKSKEEREYADEAKKWLPSLCTLSQDEHLWRYGAGSKMGDTLRAALVSDLNQWPGRYLAEVMSQALGLGDNEAFKGAVIQLVDRLRKGEAASLALSDFSLAASLANPTTTKGTVTDNNLGVLACAVSLPAFFQEYETAFNITDRYAKYRSLALAGLASTPACWSIVGQGFSKGCIQEKGCQKTNALAPGASIEKLTTIFRWADQLGPSMMALGSDWVRMNNAIRTYENLVSHPPTPVKPTFQVPSIEITGSKDSSQAVAAVATQLEWLQRQSDSASRKQVLGAGLDVFDSSLVLVQDALRTINVLSTMSASSSLTPGNEPLFPGLNIPSEGGDAEKLHTSIDKAQASLTKLRSGIKLIQATIDENWSEVGRVIVVDFGAFTRKPELRKKIEKHLGFIVAVANAKTSDDMAEAFDQVIAPPGGWRTKGQKDIFTLSVTSHVGMFAGGELRYGQYGAKWEDGKSHWQAPALAMPTGLEATWDDGLGLGVHPIGLFVPVIDPASFLQYDAEEHGQLPSARLLTVFSPGVGFRFGIKETPFSFMPLAVYRPGFRAWDKSFTENGADAYQLGLLFSVDVTLFTLSQSEGRP